MDDKLIWVSQIDALFTCIRKLQYMFKNMSEIIDKDTLKLVYNSLYEPILHYLMCLKKKTSKIYLEKVGIR